jgi:hypothetical protein
VGDIAAHEQYLGRESIVRVPDGISGKPVAVQNVVPIFSESPSGHRWLGRSLGADDDAILGGEIGVDDADLERFRAAGVIASDPAETRRRKESGMWQADRVEVTVLVENWVDMLLPTSRATTAWCATAWWSTSTRSGPRRRPRTVSASSCAPTADVIASPSSRRGPHRNGAAPQPERAADRPAEIDHVVISHGHPDHFGGIFHLLDMVDAPLPVATHPDAFLPRYATMGDGRVAHFYNQAFQPAPLEAAGGKVTLSRAPVDLGWGVATTGQIARDTDFEGPPATATAFTPGCGRWRRTGTTWSTRSGTSRDWSSTSPVRGWSS